MPRKSTKVSEEKTPVEQLEKESKKKEKTETVKKAKSISTKKVENTAEAASKNTEEKITEVSKKVSEAVSSSANFVANAAKQGLNKLEINAKINEHRQKIDKNYLLLGKSYYQSHSDDPADDLKKICATITNDIKSINQLENQLGPKQKICPQCGGVVKEDDAFCKACGCKLGDVQATKTCPRCGAELNSNAKFCTKCGFKL